MFVLPQNAPLTIVHAHVFDAKNALFKNMRKGKAELQLIYCGMNERCDLLKRGQCSWRSTLGWHACPYGKYKTIKGPTPRARKYGDWIDEQKTKYKGVKYLEAHKNILAFVGDYVFLPYPHMDMAEVGFIQKNIGLFGKGCAFLPIEKFTVDTIIELINFRPQALMGGEISSYQKEEVPKFIKHLEELAPGLFKELLERCEWVKEIQQKYSYIGRKAILETITPNVGKLVDIHKGEWVWDGEYLTSTNSHASFMIVNKFIEIRIKPLPDQSIVITDNGQVNPNTKFLD